MNQPNNPKAPPEVLSKPVSRQAPAKVNLYLEILGKRPDGFHEISTVMSAVSVFDTLSFRVRNDDAIVLTLTRPTDSASGSLGQIPVDSRNLVVQAVKNFLVATTNEHEVTGVDIQLNKQIPVAAGLGGASSNAAATLLAMQELTNVQLSRQSMLNLASELGSDVPFFLFGGTAVCTGRGEIISPLEAPAGLPIVIVRPNSGLSTPEVYANVKCKEQRSTGVPLKQMLGGVRAGDARQIGRSMTNGLQTVARNLNRDIQRVAIEFEKLNCLGHQLSGSGSCYFGLFGSRRVASVAAKQLENRLPEMNVYCSHTIGPTTLMAA